MRLSVRMINVALAAAMLVSGNALAEDAAAENPHGWLFRQLFGDSLDKDKIGVFGWAEATLIGATHGDDVISPGSFLNTDAGLNTNQIGLMACKGDACAPSFMFGPSHNVLSRIGPLPGPRSEDFDLAWNLTAVYGEDSQFLRTAGFDDFSFDEGEDNLLAITQWYVDMYVPVADGATLLLGSWHTSLANDIGYSFTPPNWFATHTYSFQHGPSKHVGALGTIKIPTSEEFGLLSLEAGLVAGWNNLEEARPTIIGGARWRSPDMRTWVDLELIYGDGEGDAFGPAEGGSPYVAISATDDELPRFNGFLVATHQLSDDWQLGFEASYGFQDGGDSLPGLPPFAVTEDSEWYGVDVAGRYKIKDNLHFGVRGEWFNDENGIHALWGSTGGEGGEVWAATAGLDWRPSPFVRLRPEVRVDYYDGGGAGLFAGGTEDTQILGALNAVLYF